MTQKRIIVAITGASGAIYGVRLLECLSSKNLEVYLVISKWGGYILEKETDYSLEEVKNLANESFLEDRLDGRISSGSFQFSGMVIIPCSMKTLAAISQGYAHNLICRAADVTIKEHRRLIIVPRETPLSKIHLENMLRLAKLGAVILPPVPAFYSGPTTLKEVIDHTVGRVLDHLQIEHQLYQRWNTPR